MVVNWEARMQWFKVAMIKPENDEAYRDKGHFLFVSFYVPSKESGEMWH